MVTSLYSLTLRGNLVERFFVGDTWDLKGFAADDFCLGREIAKLPAGITFTSSMPEMEGDLDNFVVNDAIAPVVSRRFLEVINGLNVPSSQAFPANAVWSSDGGKRSTS